MYVTQRTYQPNEMCEWKKREEKHSVITYSLAAAIHMCDNNKSCTSLPSEKKIEENNEKLNCKLEWAATQTNKKNRIQKYIGIGKSFPFHRRWPTQFFLVTVTFVIDSFTYSTVA